MSAQAPSSLDALQELMALREFIEGAQREIKAGRMPDMTALDQRTAVLCAIIQKSTGDVQQKCAPELKDLAQQLDACEQEMRAFFESVVAPALKK